MSKAFDTVNHSILLDKLKFYGLSDVAVDFFKSYLENRFQMVTLNGLFSEYKSVNVGVPQGSILGPVLFIIYVNDLPSSLDNNFLSSYMFADDLAILISCKHANLVHEIVEKSNSIVRDWSAANYLCLNNEKTQSLDFSLKYKSDVGKVKFLGVVLQENLIWEEHLDILCNKVSKGIFLLLRLKSIVNIDILAVVYYAYIHSHLAYGIIVWGNDCRLKRVMLLQKRAIRTMCNVNYRVHCKPLFRQLGILTVSSLYILEVLCYTKKNLNVIPSNRTVHSHFTRNFLNLRPNQCNYHITKNSFLEVGKKLYNLLPNNLKILDEKDFRKYLKQYLVNLAAYSIDEFIESL